MTTQAPPENEPTWYGLWLPRLAIGAIVVLTVWFGAIWVFTSTTDFLMTLVITFFAAFAMLPAVDWLTNKRGWRRGLSTAVVMGITGIVALVFAAAIFRVFVDQVIAFIDGLPDIVDNATIWLSDNFSIDIDLSQFDLETGSAADFLGGEGGDILGVVVGFAGTAVGAIFRIMTIALFLFYLLADFPRFRKAMLSRLSPERQFTTDTVISITIEKVGGYIYSRALLAGISAAFHFIVFFIIDLPYPLALALWVGIVSQFIPTIGTYLAGVVPVVVGLASGEPIDGVIVLIAILIYQQIENYAIANRVTRNTMELHPAIAFGSAIVGGSLLGGIGALLALPAAATIIALVDTYTNRYDIVENERFESPEAYEARIAEYKAAKKQHKSARRHVWSRAEGQPAPPPEQEDE